MTFGKRGEGWVAAQGLLGVAYLLVPRFGPHWPLPARLAAGLAALPVLATGFVFAGYGVAALGKRFTMLPRPADDAELRTEGIYGCVRHPVYGGVVMIASAGALLTGSLTRLLLALTAFAFFDRKAAFEESWLRDQFPEYGDYADRVRRMIPGLW